MDLTKIYYCRECRKSHHREIKNLKNAVLESPRNMPSETAAVAKGVLEDYAYKNTIRQPENVVHLTRMAMERTKEWENGRVLTVSFIGGSKAVKDRVIRHAQRWSDFANIHFDFKHRQRVADIRISFRKKDGSWSEVGTDILSVDKADPTMNFGWLTPTLDDESFGQVVLHEFGHTLACIHEHSRPDAGIPWDKPKVYKYYKDVDGWAEEEVDNQVFYKYDKDLIRSSDFDKKSIMMYAVPEELTKGRYSIPFNSDLSPQDKKFIARLYPKR
jgi:hypothetical protein